MADDTEFDGDQINNLKTWLAQTLAAMSQKAANSIGHSLEIDITSFGLKEEEDIRPLVGADAVSWGLQWPEDEGLFLCLAGRDAALALARSQDDSDTLTERLEDEATFKDEEKEALGPVREALAEALREVVSTADQNDWQAAHLDLLSESAWAGGKDPVPSEQLLSAEIEVKVDGGAVSKGLVLLGPDLVQNHLSHALKPQEAPGPDGGAAPGGTFVLYPASSPLKDRILSQMGQAVQECETLPELMRGFAADETAGLVVGISQKDLPLLALLRGMKELPGCGEKPIVVVLEKPTVSNVVRCGRLGLYRVLPPEFSSGDFGERISRPE